MLKWTAIVVVGLIALAAVVALVGTFLPKSHRASKTMVLAATPATIYAAITDVANYSRWRSDLKGVEVLPDDGQGPRFREDGNNGKITFRFETLEPNRRVVTRIADPSLAFGGTWTYDLTPSGNGTELTITEDGEVYNPIFRTISKFMSQTATIERYLADLQKHTL